MIDWKRFEEDENYLYDEDDAIKQLKPDDYYFQLDSIIACGTNGDHYFNITPKGYFDLTGALSNLSGIADHVVPDKFYELQESVYEYDGNPQVGRQLLLNAGFIEKKMF
jgi:hypothetical protein